MRVVQSFTREPVQQKAFHGVNDRYRGANYETVVLNGIYFPIVDLLSSAATAIVLGYGGWLVYHGEMTRGTLFAFALYLSNFFDPIQQLSQLYNTFLVGDRGAGQDHRRARRGAAGRRRGRRDRAAADRRPRPLRRRPLRLRAGVPGGAARARPRRRRPARRSRSSATPAPASRRSRSCSRASTTRPTGTITIDGHDLRDVTQRSLRRQLGIVPQEGFLFAGTVAENIAFGRPDARPEEIAARRRGRRRAATSSSSSRTATRRSSASAAPASRSASASSSPSPARSSPTRAS